MKLSKNFDLSEFTRSDTAARMGITLTPSPDAVNNIARLVTQVLQPLRDAYGKPLTISSGYRNPAVNAAVGGVETSHHLTGKAADVKADDPRALLTKLLEIGVSFDQAILYPTFLHVSYNIDRNRKQILYAKGVKPL